MTISKHEIQPQDKSANEAINQANGMIGDFITEALNSPNENEQIKGTLASYGLDRLTMKKQYEQARSVSLNAAQFTLDGILNRLIDHEKYTEMLSHRDCDSVEPSLGTYLRRLQQIDHRIKQLKDFFEAEYFKIDPELKVMPDYLREKIRSFQTQAPCVEKCQEQLLYATVLFSNPEHLSFLVYIPLKEIANAHNNSYLDLLLGREALRRAQDSASYVELATDLLMCKNVSYTQQTNRLEHEHDVGLNKKRLEKDIKSFITEQGEFHVKSQLIKAAIEQKLIGSDSLSPWTLGWTGSRSSITFAGKTFNVPRGIFELYQLVQSPKENMIQIKELISEKQNPIHSMYSFFHFVTGTSRSEETQETYAELNSILSREY
ncbi:MAG: hypothetical protein LEGION0403_FIIPPAGN_02299 [Legionella sp.]|uniref:hypothetical protein n=1 Tax=Legionella sp. TaxID=459 RepID=UPI003D0FAC1A